jgi:DNA-binding NarL/FixJ family response regulator
VNVIRVLIADDDALVRAGVRTILASAEDIDVVAEASNGREAVDEAERRTIDVALLDIRMPDGGGLEAVAAMATRAPKVRTAILTTFGDEAYITQALADGATGFLLKDSAPEELIHAVRAVAAGEAYLSPAVTRRVIKTLKKSDTGQAVEARRLLDRLTPREREVLDLLATGLSNAEIGERLYMSEGTIKTYVSRILTKLDCTNRVRAAILAINAS